MRQIEQVVDQVADALAEVAVIRWCTPIEASNATALLASGKSVPELSYPEVDVDAVTSRLRKAQTAAKRLGTHPLRPAIEDTLDAGVETARVIAARDDDSFTQWSRSRHGLPDSETLAEAETLLEGEATCAPTPDLLQATEFMAAARQVLDAYALTEWQVVAKARLAKAAVNSQRRQLIVREDALFDFTEAAGLLVHEIGGHVLRASNAQAQPDPTASLAVGDSAPTEEGIATWLEQHLGVATSRRLRIFAARAVAIRLSATAGASEVLEILRPLVGVHEAAAITLRVKRGLINLESVGGYTKDHAYLSGFIQIRKLLAEDISRFPSLMTTKWPLELLPLAEGLIGAGALHEPRRLPSAHLLCVAQGQQR